MLAVLAEPAVQEERRMLGEAVPNTKMAAARKMMALNRKMDQGTSPLVFENELENAQEDPAVAPESEPGEEVLPTMAEKAVSPLVPPTEAIPAVEIVEEDVLNDEDALDDTQRAKYRLSKLGIGWLSRNLLCSFNSVS